MATEPLILQTGEGRFIELGSGGMTVKASDELTGGAFTLLESSSEPANFGPPMHIHHDCAEAFYILEGEYTFFLDDGEIVCGAGAFVYVPAGVVHGFRVGPVPARKLNIFVPAGMVGYFDDLAQARKSGVVDEAALGAIAAGHAMEVVGPVPEGYAS